MSGTNFQPDLERFTSDISFSHKKTTHNASYAYHRHDGCEVYLILSGNIKLYIEQACFLPAPGTLVVINSNEMHRVQTMDDNPYERIVIYLRRNYIEALSVNAVSLSDCFYDRPIGTQNLCVLSPKALQEFLRLYKGLASSTKQDCYGAPIVQNAYASLLLLFINRQFHKGPVNYPNQMPDYITNTMRYIETHLGDPLCLSVLAKHSHVSEGYLSMQFKLHTGLTLRAYLLDRKINHAKSLLQEGMNVTEVCYLSGFNDYANFIRSFKSKTGMSPGKYKQGTYNL